MRRLSRRTRGASSRLRGVELLIKMREQGPFGYIPEPLVIWRFAWFPRQLKRLPDYSKALHVFETYVQERYKGFPRVRWLTRARGLHGVSWLR